MLSTSHDILAANELDIPRGRAWGEHFMLDTKAAVHMHEDDLELYAQGRLEPKYFPVVENHLLACETCQNALADCLWQGLALQLIRGTRETGTQRRAEPRFSTDREATVQELHPLSTERHKVRIVNVSKSGIGILSPKAILPGTIVQLRIKETVELGNVRYCTASGDAFQIGLRLHGEG
jgi:hypothetical protein